MTIANGKSEKWREELAEIESQPKYEGEVINCYSEKVLHEFLEKKIKEGLKKTRRD
jgi:hypothetical protein